MTKESFLSKLVKNYNAVKPVGEDIEDKYAFHTHELLYDMLDLFRGVIDSNKVLEMIKKSKSKENYEDEDVFTTPVVFYRVMLAMAYGRYKGNINPKQTTVIGMLGAVMQWELSERKYYRIGYDFGKELYNSRISIQGSALIALKDKPPAFFEFPQPIIVSNRHRADVAMVQVREVADRPGEYYMTLVTFGLGSDRVFQSFAVHPQVTSDGDIEDIVDRVNKPGDDVLAPSKFIAYLAKCFLYIHTGNPDLRELIPKKMTQKERRQACKQYNTNISFPQILVSWGWKKPRVFIQGSWYSTGHFGWRWCGEGRTRLELKWIKESIKHRKTGEVLQEVEDAEN